MNKIVDVTWVSDSLPKESGEYLLTSHPYSVTNNSQNVTLFGLFDKDTNEFTLMDRTSISEQRMTVIAWAEKPEPCDEYFAP